MKKSQMFILIALILVGAGFAGASYFYRAAEPKVKPVESTGAKEALNRPDAPSMGPENAAVTIVEFLDPECEACKAMHPIVKKLMKEYEGKVRLVIRYMPFHGNSMYAASALEEARETGHFEKALDVLFEHQEEWGSHHNPRPELIPTYLQKIGMSQKVADRAYVIGKHGSKVERDHRDGILLGVRGTPTFFFNGKMASELGYEPLKAAIEKELAQL